MTFGSSKLAGTTQSHKEFLASCVKLLLLWVAASDGRVDKSELRFASSQFDDTTGSLTTEDLLSIIEQADLASLEKAIRALTDESRELRTAFLDLAITMSMADRRIAFTENHILRFYADALHLGTDLLERRFNAISGQPLPGPGDAGSEGWWKHADQLVAEEAEQEKQELWDPNMTPVQARAMLGLATNASPKEVEKAYQDLTAIFQLSRVESMGEAAVAVARERLGKIQQAYELLQANSI